MKLSIFTILIFLSSMTLFGQTTMNLTGDLVLSETLVLDEDTVINGNGFKIICDGCNPMISVRDGANASFENTYFQRGYARWIEVVGASSASWNSPRMVGSISGLRSGQ